VIIVISTLCSSCYYNKRWVYIQDKSYSESIPTQVKNENTQYRLRPNDILSVKVKSSTEAGIADIFNIAPTGQFFSMDPGNMYLQGYSIDPMGQINLPILGSLTVKDLTLDEAENLIQQQANRFLNNATVIVKLVSFKITVLGEVNRPGYRYIFNNQATILEGLGLAGDLSENGNRKRIKLVRQVPTGSEVVMVDLTDPKILTSKYYYLMPNDVIYVEPLRAQSKRSNLALMTLFFSAVTTTVLVLNYFESD
jgi:polysaccharide export outer membrane protein